jgi:hypothetical protein
MRRSAGPYSETVRGFMSKVELLSGDNAEGQGCPPQGRRSRPRIALLSNPKSTGNLAQLPRIREFCAEHPDLFHYEVEHANQIGEAIKSIARVRPRVLVINGGDGTVQATLTELHNGGHFGDEVPPVAVLPSGKTNLIALDLGARGDPVEALEQLLRLARENKLAEYTVARELIALRHGTNDRPVIGMFMGGAGLADTMLYCRDKIYPLGLPNGMAHVITAFALLMKLMLRLKASFLPPDPAPLSVSLRENGHRLDGRFSLLAVTTLEKLLLASNLGMQRGGALKILAVEERPSSILRGLFAGFFGRLGRDKVSGVHFESTDRITIEGDNSNVILDGEMFRAERGFPINLTPAQPLSFVKLAA